LGEAALYLAWRSYLIHGTNRPDGVGRSGSYGCLTLYPEDIRVLFDAVAVGTSVRVLRQDTAAVWENRRLLVQIYPNEEQGRFLHPVASVTQAVTADLQARVRVLAKAHMVQVNWPAVDAARWDRTGLPVPVGR